MAIKQLYGKTYYADYIDANGVRRRVSLQTTNLKAAQLKYGEILHRRNAIPNISLFVLFSISISLT